ncbi:hypothetical protein ACA40_01945 [Pseudomonas syringae pv. lapsa]|nr:hypothetical protein ACA40_01945 [Pseudomonas syringae pv. lapsa]PHN43572.1 hypothetical protein AO254_18920 [Pseudomonas syringae]
MFGRLGDPFADKSAPTPVGQNQKRPSARGVGANLFAKTVVQAMHVRRLGDPFADKSAPTPVGQNQNGLLPEG